MFFLQRLNATLASHAACTRVAPFAFGPELRDCHAQSRPEDQGHEPVGAAIDARKSAQDDRRIIHKQQRARELAAVTAYRRDTDPDGVTPDIRGTYAPDITQMVWDRRAQDKIGPLVRWARATIAADPVLRSASRAEQVAYFARPLLAPTLPGWNGSSARSWKPACTLSSTPGCGGSPTRRRSGPARPRCRAGCCWAATTSRPSPRRWPAGPRSATWSLRSR